MNITVQTERSFAKLIDRQRMQIRDNQFLKTQKPQIAPKQTQRLSPRKQIQAINNNIKRLENQVFNSVNISKNDTYFNYEKEKNPQKFRSEVLHYLDQSSRELELMNSFESKQVLKDMILQESQFQESVNCEYRLQYLKETLQRVENLKNFEVNIQEEYNALNQEQIQQINKYFQLNIDQKANRFEEIYPLLKNIEIFRKLNKEITKDLIIQSVLLEVLYLNRLQLIKVYLWWMITKHLEFIQSYRVICLFRYCKNQNERIQEKLKFIITRYLLGCRIWTCFWS